MTNLKTNLLMTAVVLACAAPLSAQTTDMHSPADHMTHQKMDSDHKAMHEKMIMWDAMSDDEKKAKWKTMSKDEQAMVKKHIAMQDEKMKHSNMSKDGNPMKMDKVPAVKKMKMEEPAGMTDSKVKMENLTDKQKHKIGKGMHPSKINDTAGEYLQDDAKSGDDQDRALAVPGSNNTVTTVTCPAGTTAQPNMTCLVTGDYAPE